MVKTNIGFTYVENIIFNTSVTVSAKNPMSRIPFWNGDNRSFSESLAVA